MPHMPRYLLADWRGSRRDDEGMGATARRRGLVRLVWARVLVQPQRAARVARQPETSGRADLRRGRLDVGAVVGVLERGRRARPIAPVQILRYGRQDR